MAQQQTVLALCAHPDDAEFRCGGTLVLLAHLGWKVHIATLCAGDCGSAELPPNVIAVQRRAEATAAAARVGGEYHWLGGQDLQVYDDNVMRGAATAVIRRVDPDFVLTHYPMDYMVDHDVASAVARTAVFTAPMPNYVVGAAASVAATDAVVPLYYFGGPLDGVDYFGNPVAPHFAIDITSVIDEKAAVLGCHASQREWLRRQHGVDQYIDEMRRWDADAGRRAGVAYAEGFFQHLGHGYPHIPILQDAVNAYLRTA